MKSELEATIKISDSKNVEIVSVMKEVESVVETIGVRQQEFHQMLAKQKRLFEIWGFFDRREDDLINQKIRTIRVLDELDFFSIDDDQAEFFENFTEMFFSQIPELNIIDFFQILEGFDFSSIPIFSVVTFQK